MYKLLVVDDHPYQVDNITHSLEHSELQLETIYKAYSGAEALEVMKRVSIDIVITDIRMPEMSGIELIEHIRRMSGRTKCVLLSGYADFQYAQQALALQTSKYLMKPVEQGELLRTVEMVVGQLASERESEEHYRQTLSALHESLPQLRGDLLKDLIKGKHIPRKELAHKLKVYQIPFSCEDLFALMVFQLEDDLSGFNQYDVSLIMYGIANMAEEVFKEDFHIWHGRISSRRLVMIIRPAAQDAAQWLEQIELRAKKLQKLIYRYLKHIVSIGFVRSAGSFPDQLRTSYDNVTAVFNSPEGRAAGFFAGVSDFPEPRLKGSIESLYRQPSLMSLLEMGRWEETRSRLDIVFAELESKSAATNEYIMEAFYVIAGTYQFAAHMNGKRLSEVIAAADADLLQDHAHWDLKAFQAWVLRTFEALEANINGGDTRNNLSLVSRVHRYIDNHLEEELSLQSISGEVGLHPAYLSKIYKQETGVNLSDYLLQVRMEYSAELLKNTDYKIYEVSSRVGYQSSHYFIKLFKKSFGMTPVEYRCMVKKNTSR